MGDADLWYVMLADGDVHRVTLDQLDEAFQAGHIDQETLVLADGARQWTPLGKLAGLDETPPPPQVPVTTSFRPVSVDLSDVDFEAVQFRSRPSKGWFAAIAGLAVIGTVAGVATTSPTWARPYVDQVESFVNRTVLRRSSVAAPVVATSPPPALPDPAPQASSATLTALPSAASAVAPASTDAQPVPTAERFAPDLKQKLLDADKSREQKSKAHSGHAAPSHAHGSPKSKSGVFTTGGNKYDPLNSAIP